MGKDIFVGQTVNITKENMSKIRELEKEYTLGLTGQFIVAPSLNGKRHGQGIFESANGSIYRGEWFDDLMTWKWCNYRKMVELSKVKWKHGKLLTKPILYRNPLKTTDCISAHIEKTV